MSIELLPDHLLLDIFSLLNQCEIVLDLKCVCVRWKQLIEEFGLPNKILKLRRFPKSWGTFEQGKIMINQVLAHFPSLVRLEFDNFFKPVDILDKELPQLVEVTFTLSSIRSDDVLKFIRFCPNLRCFGVYWEFNLNDTSLMEIICQMKFLEKFEIDSAFRFDLRGRFIERFRDLKSLYIDLGQPLDHDLILHLVNKNGDTLHSLSLKPVEYRHIRIIGSKLKNLQYLRLMRVQRFMRPSYERYDFSGLRNLTCLHIDSWETIQTPMLQEFFEEILKAASSLTEFKTPCYPLDGLLVMNLIGKYCPNLVKLTLIQPEFGDEVCSKFSCLPKLQELVITGGKHRLTDDGRQLILSLCPLLHHNCNFRLVPNRIRRFAL